MIRFECDRCKTSLSANDARRFIVRIEAYAAAGPVDLSADALEKDHSESIRRIIEQLNGADPDDVEDQTYRGFRFDLCTECHRAFLAKPLG